jgi:TonB-linked outer membrane protein, SusC/RagA family
MLMLSGILAFAQNRQVTGTVTDNNGTPITSASVTVNGSRAGTTTDQNGFFSINARNGSALTISALNYASQVVPINNQTSIKVTLERSTRQMEEVIVTAGGIRTRRKEVGTATTLIRSEVLTAGKAVNVAAGLQGKVAGLQISGTSGGANPNFRIILRGQRSLTGNNQALLVLDNVIVPNEFLSNLNPEDVEDVVVLNGANAAALYGSQGSNGAIIVTTRKGRRGVTSIGISNTTTIESVAFYPKIQKGFGSGGSAYGSDANGQPLYSELENQSYGPAFDNTMRALGSPLENGMQDSAVYAYNKGHLDFWEKGITNQTDLSLSTGDDNSTFFMSGQYARVTGTTPEDKYNRVSFRANGTRKIGQKILVTYATDYAQNRYDQTTQTGSMYTNMLNMPSNVDITRYKNWRTDPLANPIGFYNPWYQNPYFTLDNYRQKIRNDYFVGNVELKFTPLTGLDIVARQGVTTKNSSNKSTVGGFSYTTYSKNTPSSSKSDISASVADGSSYKTNLSTTVYAQYNRTIATNYSFNLIGGASATQDEAKYVNVSGNGLVVPGLFNVSNGVGTPGATESNYKTRQFGVYGDLRVGYKNFLYLHATGRNDWVSILNPNNWSFFYPSVDVSFIATDAISALKNNKTVSYLKLRGGWSKVGEVNLGNSTNLGAYQLLPTYSSTSFGFPYGSLAGFTVDNTLVSPNLNPEITKGYEAGFDLNLLNDRITSSFTWYSTKTSNQTITTSISSSTGFTGLRTNIGETQSSGIEINAHVTPLRSRSWNVTIGGNYTYLDNKVNFISADLPRLALATYGSTAGSYAIAGQVFPVIMGYDYKRDPSGHVIVDASTGLPTKSDTISILGNAVPKNRIGIDGSIKFKNFTLSFLFDYRGGYKIYNNMGPEMDWSGTGYRTGIYNRQRFVFPNSVIADPANPGKYIANTNIEIKNGNGNNGFWTDGINRDVTSNYITSGDFWKLREASLAYDVPGSFLSRTKFIKGIRISVQGRNLLMWMAKDNYYTDPEYSDAGNDSNGIGLTGLNTPPPSRYYGATISFKF